MKTRKELKQCARKSYKKNYIMSIIVAFITTIIITGGYNFYTDAYYNVKNNQWGKFIGIDNDFIDYAKDAGYEVEDENLSPEETFEEILGIQRSNENDSKNNYARGVLAIFANKINSSHSFVFGMISSFNTLLFGGNISRLALVITTASILLIFYIFIRNVFIVGRTRYFLESTKYTKTSADKVFFAYNTKKSFQIAWIMFTKEFFTFLWSLTIIGGIIKRYSYMMIPYILAENPSISRKEAFKLSKKIMYGKKWEAFKIDLSFLGWNILQPLTFNLSNLFWSEAYYDLTLSYFYIELRQTAKETNIEYSDYLKDDALIGELVDDSYSLENYILPVRKKHKLIKIDYEKDYSVKMYILFFFTFSIVGWIWEVVLHLVNGGGFVNRGTMFGPWLPIYGFGGVLILIFLKPFRKKPILNFIFSMILCAILEYCTAWFLETVAQKKWWDYTGYYLTIQGRICLEGILVFGLGGCGFTYIFAPLLHNAYSKIKPKIITIICTILVSLFSVDFIYSTIHPNTGMGITEEHDLVEMQENENT